MLFSGFIMLKCIHITLYYNYFTSRMVIPRHSQYCANTSTVSFQNFFIISNDPPYSFDNNSLFTSSPGPSNLHLALCLDFFIQCPIHT